MSMNVSTNGASKEPDVMIEMNMTPLIDVMLVLIIMLIVTIPIQHHAVNLDMPQNSTPPLVQPSVVTVDIDPTGNIFWNGTMLADYGALDAQLRSVADMPDQAELHVRPNKLVPYKVVAHVMARAQHLGVTKIGMVGNEQFVD